MTIHLNQVCWRKLVKCVGDAMEPTEGSVDLLLSLALGGQDLGLLVALGYVDG